MSDILAIIFLIATLITAIFWIIQKKNYNAFKNKKIFLPNRDIHHCKILKKTQYISFIASFFPIFAIVFIIRSFIYEPFQIPSESMMPTLLIGDFILVEKFSYGIKDPILHYTLINTGTPNRGDVVVFRNPHNTSINYIKRVIGLPGDHITYDILNKIFIIHQKCTENNHYQKKIFITHKNNALNTCKKNDINCINNQNNTTFYYLNPKDQRSNLFLFNIIQEKIEKKTFNILISNQIKDEINEYYQQTGQKKGTWIVPNNQYFMIGDNRDNSLDSRYWGFVPDKYLIGKATKIWMSFDKEENKWPIGIRLNRIGNIN
ncbi:MAG TPA: signal peptidase I [Buchnera sp. (in: enterobacteria)]|nr:signal peptidase I [Buchnera sp. (in: enterobacteria)]